MSSNPMTVIRTRLRQYTDRVRHVSWPMWLGLSIAFATVIVFAIGVPLVLIIGLSITGVIQIEELFRVADLENLANSRFVLHEVPEGVSLLMALAGLIGITTGIWVSRSLTAPLVELSQAAKAIGQGDFERRVKADGSREIVELAHTFNQMASDLAHAETLRRNLMADVAHELRTPLTVLEGNLRAALDNVYELDEAELANLYGQTRHLVQLVNDLRELAQAEARQLPLNMVPTDVAELVGETVAVFQPLAEEKGVVMETKRPLSLPEISLDPIRIRQILHNLLSNGLRHTGQNGRITVTLKVNGSMVEIAVADNGEGMTPDQITHIFDRFYRTDSSRTRHTGGTGLGLAIAKAIAEAHGGSVRASSPGLQQGTTFVLALPI